MLVSWDWLADYVKIDRSVDAMATLWAMSGLNHESTSWVDGDPVIDLEVTSNRADCLGHIGVAREAAVLCELPLHIPDPKLRFGSTAIETVLQVENRFVEACPRYAARVIRGVKIGPSPDWMAKRLLAIGVKPINNVVDATNYVMMECGQPLHAFDLARIRGGKIIVRPAFDKENFVAIDHRNYILDPRMVVIADAERALALGGVMGGVDSEVAETTRDLLIESASFVPIAIRRAARRLKLHSPSSHRFERRIDPNQVDWASRRCCELILATAGGELLTGWVDSHPGEMRMPSCDLRQSQVTRVLGIEVPWDKSVSILTRLGCQVESQGTSASARVTPPSFRQDLTREIDLIEEIARVFGYDRIPENAVVPMVASMRRPKDIVLGTVRQVACAAGFDESLTPSLIGKSTIDRISPWSSDQPLTTLTPLLEGANVLRRSLIPSLIAARLHNQSQSNRDVRLFEIASVYLPRGSALPHEQAHLGMIAESDIRVVRGVFEEIVQRCWGSHHRDRNWRDGNWSESEAAWDFLEPGSGIAWTVSGHLLGWVGSLSKSLAQSSKLDGDVAISELNLDVLLQHARLVPRVEGVVPYPAIQRDLNLVVDESLWWKSLRDAIAASAGPLCVDIRFQEIYRDPQKDGANKKRVLLTLVLQSDRETLKSQQADAVVASVLSACEQQLGARLLAS